MIVVLAAVPLCRVNTASTLRGTTPFQDTDYDAPDGWWFNWQTIVFLAVIFAIFLAVDHYSRH